MEAPMMERKYTLIRYYGANATSLTASGVLRVGAGTMWARAAWAALILVFVIGVSFLGLYEPAHTINRASGWFEYATEGTSSDFTSLFWPNIGIFDSGNEKHSRPTNEPSISRLFFFAIFGLLGAFVCALRA